MGAGQWRIYDRCDSAGKLPSLPQHQSRRYVIELSLPQCTNVLTLYVAGDVTPIFSVLFSFFHILIFVSRVVWFAFLPMFGETVPVSVQRQTKCFAFCL